MYFSNLKGGEYFTPKDMTDDGIKIFQKLKQFHVRCYVDHDKFMMAPSSRISERFSEIETACEIINAVGPNGKTFGFHDSTEVIRVILP